MKTNTMIGTVGLLLFSLAIMSFTNQIESLDTTELMTFVVEYKFKRGYSYQKVVKSGSSIEPELIFVFDESTPKYKKLKKSAEYRLIEVPFKSNFDNSIILKLISQEIEQNWELVDHEFSISKSASDGDGVATYRESEYISVYTLKKN